MNFRQIAVSAAEKTAKIIDNFVDFGNFTYKNKFSFQSKMDLLAEEAIVKEIKKYYPKHAIFSEESGEMRGKSDFLWVIDPIDGTTNFLYGIPEFNISIALLKKEKIILGLVYNPISKKYYLAEKNKGCRLNSKKTKVSQRKNLIEFIGSSDMTSKYPFRKQLFDYMKDLSEHVHSLKMIGGTALQMGLVAEGKVDFYFKNRFNFWDVAAGIIMIEESGGKVTDFEGKKVTKNSPDLLASNQIAHKEILRLLQQTKKNIQNG